VESEHNEVDGMKKGVDSKGEVMHIYILSKKNDIKDKIFTSFFKSD